MSDREFRGVAGRFTRCARFTPMARAGWRRARLAFALAFGVFAAGVAISASKYPEQPYDWGYVVMSALASHKRNPEGGHWFAAALGLSMLLLWPVVSYLRDEAAPGARRWPIVALRIALLCGLAVGVERLVFVHLSDLVFKGHELLALGMFVGLYAGVLGLYAERMRHGHRSWAGALVVGAPLAAIGITQLALFLDQRDLGWVDTGWRAMGVPVWLSFAFWQWLAVAILWVGLGHLVWTRQSGGPIEPPGGAS
ncbi:MAG: hypothetical protein ACREST_07065 [Steroidobacteraceae bacterium]